MQLVPNAAKAWRWFSVQAMAVSMAMQGAWLALPPDMQDRIPSTWVDAATVVVLALGIIGRVFDQGTTK